jgi:hypothetical protein
MSCPRCLSAIVTRDGTTHLGGQRFRCGHCGRRFTRRSDSAFSCRAFPDDVIALAVRWYVRYRLSYAEVSEWLAERRPGRPEHHLPLGAAFPAAVRRGGSNKGRRERIEAKLHEKERARGQIRAGLRSGALTADEVEADLKVLLKQQRGTAGGVASAERHRRCHAF